MNNKPAKNSLSFSEAIAKKKKRKVLFIFIFLTEQNVWPFFRKSDEDERVRDDAVRSGNEFQM